jgi:hypothetical protein
MNVDYTIVGVEPFKPTIYTDQDKTIRELWNLVYVVLTKTKNKLVPDEETVQLLLLRDLFELNKQSFRMIGSLHQNNKDDPLHFTITYKNRKIYFEGYYNGCFYLTRLVMVNKTGKDVIATYNNNWNNVVMIDDEISSEE